MTQQRSGPGRPRDAELGGKVVQTAIELLMERGYEDVTIEAVARRAGVSRSAVYARWPALPDLLFEATMAARAQVSSATGSELIVPDTGSLRGDLLAVIEQGNEIFDLLERVGLLRGILSDAIRHPHLADRLRVELLEPDEAGYRIIFERAVDRGEIAADSSLDMDLVPQLMIGLAVQRRLLTGRSFDASVAASAVDLVIEGLVTRDG